MSCYATTLKNTQCKKNANENGLCWQHVLTKSNKKFGQNAKSRAGSTRNGFNVSVSNTCSKDVLPEQITKRNDDLQIDINMCFYCKDNIYTDDDHLIPSCRTQLSIYGQNNMLNRIPSCKTCNGSKGGKTDEEFKKWLQSNCHWEDEKIKILFEWIEINTDNLYLDKETVEYLNTQHVHINKMHDIMQQSAEKKEDIMTNLIKHIVADYPDKIHTMLGIM